METTNRRMRTIIAVLMMMLPITMVHAQTSGSSMDTAKAAGVAFTSDTAFIRKHIRQEILTIKMAQLAGEKQLRPEVQTVARNIIAEQRDILQKLLAMAEKDQLEGVKASDLDKLLNDFNTAPVNIATSDTAASATSGNTVTDSLGSGSSGSGNVHGRDTGTLGRTHARNRNANYSASGKAYGYNNQKSLELMKDKDRGRKRKMESRWVSNMLAMQNGTLAEFSGAVDHIRGQELKTVVLEAIPRVRMQKNALERLRRGKEAAEGVNNSNPVSGNQNSGNK